ncbi:MAG: host-nuclease inhibitor Gam family protein [Clostridia bacterium]|nr:host-nuclease inhibitor Gam family protein [Clostridia bacterium]
MDFSLDHLALKIIDEAIEEQTQPDEGFVIDNDAKAEWALKKICEERAEAQRYIQVCETMISEYQEKIRKAEEKLKSKTSYLETLLLKYFETVSRKVTKTQESYKLPSGTLKLKRPSPEYIRDDAELLKWLKENSLDEYIRVEEKLNWSELKKKLSFSGEKVIDENGQIIEGIKVVEKPPVFEIET